jgi:putative ABC transport system permease protein
MGRILLVFRLAVRDLRRRPLEAVLLLLAITAATSALTLGLVLRDAAANPYEKTRAATSGPDVVAGGSDLEGLAGAPGVTAHSGPFPVTAAKLQAFDRTVDVQAVGRDATPAAVDQPELLRGGWVRDGGVVVEAAFANALGVHVGDRVTLDGRSFAVVGVAVSAALAPYPGGSCIVLTGCMHGPVPKGQTVPAGLLHDPGLVWLTRAEVRSLNPDPHSSVLNLKLADPNAAQSFAEADHGDVGLQNWQSIRADATESAGDAQILMLIGAWLLGLLAMASLAVLVGGRMADQTRRVGLLKAAGGTPGLVAAVLLAEYLLVALAAAAAGLAIGSLTAPLLTAPSAGLIGSAATPPLSVVTTLVVTAVALGVAMVATAVPALRAARSSTVGALADSARPPRRTGWLIAVSARLPVALLLAVRIAARRPRRVVLAVVSIAVTISGIYVTLIFNAYISPQSTGYDQTQVAVLHHVLLVVMVVLFGLAAVNALFITWATVIDNRRSSALARALGATPGEVSAALAAAQVLPALAGALIGVFPGGFGLFAAIIAITSGDRDRATLPSLGQLAAVVLSTVVVVAALTAVPARLGGRRPVAETWRA